MYTFTLFPFAADGAALCLDEANGMGYTDVDGITALFAYIAEHHGEAGYAHDHNENWTSVPVASYAVLHPNGVRETFTVINGVVTSI